MQRDAVPHRSWRFLSLAFLLVSGGCSLRRIAIAKVGDALAASGSSYSEDDDPELVADAVPFSLKLIESLLAESPRHEGMLLAACRGFTQYSYGFIQQKADETEEVDVEEAARLRGRARRLDLRARAYGVRALEVRHPGFGAALARSPAEAVKVTTRKDVALLYWTSAAWGAAISLSKDDPALVADQPIVEAMIDRALELDEGFDHGAIHGFLIAYETSRPGSRDALERASIHAKRAAELDGEKRASTFVSLAENVLVPMQDAGAFRQVLESALAIDPAAAPEFRLENLVMQRRARWLLRHTDDLFSGITTTTNGETK